MLSVVVVGFGVVVVDVVGFEVGVIVETAEIGNINIMRNIILKYVCLQNQSIRYNND